ncbi:hypothetical protein [Paeniglutamicibacter sp.]|uniref:hypothetical protein n=1 Tax=Paeniglutamicibacter sp. TaxID=1934391 RepID=UPI00398A4209
MNNVQSVVPVVVGASVAETPASDMGEASPHGRSSVPAAQMSVAVATGREGLRDDLIRPLLLSGVCAVGWAAAILAGHYCDFGPMLHRIGLAVHILALVFSFGTILVIDWIGFLWLLGKRAIHEPGRLEAAAKPLIWGGLALLLASGALIHPDLSSTPTRVKLACVLVLMLNGLWIAPVMRRVLALPPDTRFGAVGRWLRMRLMIALAISQTCWWSAALIGMLNSTLRRWSGS